jgi:hypothetical protein
VQPRADGGESVHLTPQLDLGEDPGDEAPDAAPALEAEAVEEQPEAVEEQPADESVAETAQEPAEE